MKTTLLLIFITAGFLHLSCSSSRKESDKLKASPNEAILLMSQVSGQADAEKKFPVPDTLKLPLKTVTTSSGSFSSISLGFEEKMDGRIFSFELFLPSAPKFKLVHDQKQNISLGDVTFPYELKSEDYIPFKNALNESEIFPGASLMVKMIGKTETNNIADIMYFTVGKIVVNAFLISDGKASISMAVELSTDTIYNPAYGVWQCSVDLNADDATVNMLMVD